MSSAGSDKEMGSFAAALNCIDGRAQLPVNEAVRSLFGATYVDTITAPGIVRFLADATYLPEARAALSSVRVSVEKHGSRAIAVAAHHDCAGNPCGKDVQLEQLERAVAYLAKRFPQCRVAGLWVDENWSARVVCSTEAAQ